MARDACCRYSLGLSVLALTGEGKGVQGFPSFIYLVS